MRLVNSALYSCRMVGEILDGGGHVLRAKPCGRAYGISGISINGMGNKLYSRLAKQRHRREDRLQLCVVVDMRIGASANLDDGEERTVHHHHH